MQIAKSTSCWRRNPVPKRLSLINSLTASSLSLTVIAAAFTAGVIYIKSFPIEFIHTTYAIVEGSKHKAITRKKDNRSSTVINNSAKEASSSISGYCSSAWELIERIGQGGSTQMAHKTSKLPQAPAPPAEAHHSQNPFHKLHNFFFKHDAHPSDEKLLALQHFPNTFPRTLVLTNQQIDLIRALSSRVRLTVPHFYNRAAQVSWGGPSGPKWYYPAGNNHYGTKGVDALDGGHLLYAYLRVMKWPSDLHSHFPTKLCSKGCNAEVAIEHTLEFREKFKPWLVTPAAIQENRAGFIYHRGYSPAVNDEGKFVLVWYRPGIHKVDDAFAYLRALVHTLDRAVADSLRSSHSREGKVNVVIDMHGFSFSMIPKLAEIKMFLKILQDHLPGRMGTVFLVNVSTAAEFAYNLVKPLLAKEAREKIFIFPHDPDKKQKMLQSVIEQEYIPDWLGGPDKYKFDPDTYYPQSLQFSNDEGLEYLQTMPYHALHQ